MGLFDLPIEIRMLELRRVECRKNNTGQVSIPDQFYSANTAEQLISVLKAAIGINPKQHGSWASREALSGEK